MRVYLDVCRLGRLTDDQTQRRIREEAEAVELVLGLVARGSVEWIATEALVEEIHRNPSAERRMESETLLAMASEASEMDDRIAERARELQSDTEHLTPCTLRPPKRRVSMCSSLRTTSSSAGPPTGPGMLG